MGKPFNVTNKYGVVTFNLTNRNDNIKESLPIRVDERDFLEFVYNTTYWIIHIDKRGARYVRRTENSTGVNIHLHREIYSRYKPLQEFKNGKNIKCIVDHINRDSLDNRLCNLRAVDLMENLDNSDRNYRGISYMGACISFIEKRDIYQAYRGKKYLGSSKNLEALKNKITLLN